MPTARPSRTTRDQAASELLVLQVRRDDGGGWALPGTFLHEGEVLADAVVRSLSDKAGVRGLRPRQLYVFDEAGRDARGWVLSVGHVSVVQLARLDSRFVDRTRLMPVRQPGRMWNDHRDIIGRAVDDVRRRYRTEPDPDGLLGDRFTLRELRRVHEAVVCNATPSQGPWHRVSSRRGPSPKAAADGPQSCSAARVSAGRCAGSGAAGRPAVRHPEPTAAGGVRPRWLPTIAR